MSLKEKIISNMPKDLDELGIARYLYIALGKELYFSTKFQNTDDSSYGQLYIETVDINSFKGSHIICRMWSQLYSQLLDLYNIDNKIVDSGHQYIEFNIQGKRWVADATYGSYTDLARIHNNDELQNFGPLRNQDPAHTSNMIRIDSNTAEQLKIIDDKIGYNNSRKQNLIDLRNMLEEIKKGTFNIKSVLGIDEQSNLDETILKLEYLFSKIGVLNGGYYESKDTVYEFERYILTSEEFEKVKAVELKRTNRDKEVDIIQCIYVKNEPTYNYYLLAPNQKIQKVQEPDLVKLAVLGYGIEDKTIPGIMYPKNFIKGKVSTGLKYYIDRRGIPNNLKPYDLPQSNKKR